MLDAAAAEAATRSLMLGTSRQALPLERAFGDAIAPDDPRAALKALALLAQRGRFRRPPRTPPIVAEPLFPDGRAIIPENARALLISLFPGKCDMGWNVAAYAVADALARKRLKLHPFELPRLENFLKAHCERLGGSAVAWVDRRAIGTSGDPRDRFFVETIDETNWTHGRPTQKAAFIRGLRATNASRARELVESAFGSEPVPVRVGLVNALAEKLSSADRPFLEGLAKDRAQSVRAAADALLVRLPGTAQSAQRLQECAGRIKVTKGGLLRRRTVLRLEFPVTVQKESRTPWAMDAFGMIGLEDLVELIGLPIEEIVTAAAEDQVLNQVLAVQTARAQRYDLLAGLVRAHPACIWATMDPNDDSGAANPAAALAWSAAAIQPDLWAELPNAGGLASIYRKVRAPLPESTARSLLGSDAWRSFLDSLRREPPTTVEGSLDAIVALTPPSPRAVLRADLAPLDPSLTARALALVTLLDRIEAA